MTLLRLNYLLYCLDNYIDDTLTETGLGIKQLVLQLCTIRRFSANLRGQQGLTPGLTQSAADLDCRLSIGRPVRLSVVGDERGFSYAL